VQTYKASMQRLSQKPNPIKKKRKEKCKSTMSDDFEVGGEN